MLNKLKLHISVAAIWTRTSKKRTEWPLQLSPNYHTLQLPPGNGWPIVVNISASQAENVGTAKLLLSQMLLHHYSPANLLLRRYTPRIIRTSAEATAAVGVARTFLRTHGAFYAMLFRSDEQIAVHRILPGSDPSIALESKIVCCLSRNRITWHNGADVELWDACFCS